MDEPAGVTIGSMAPGPPDQSSVRVATDADVPALADMLVRAFDDDPVANFMFAGHRRRQRGLRAFFLSQLRRMYMPCGHVYTTAERDAAALWGPPDMHRNGLKELFQLLPVAPYLASERTHRALQLLFEVDALHPKEPHWYLATLGTDPPAQGTGRGSALMTSMMARADQSGVPAYLESSKEKNVPFYARFGFEVVEELKSKPANPTIWRMWREPRPPEG
jgi:GNAT superfamily N-acetyltransferase